MSDAQGFKRLGFVSDGGATIYTEAEKLYKKARSFAPPAVEQNLARVETSVAPVVVKAQALSTKLLHYADEQVDYVVHTAQEQASHMHETQLKTYQHATETYMTYMTKASDYAALKLSPASKGVQAARDTLHAALKKAREAADPDVALQMAWDAWTAFAAYPPVAKLLDSAEPATKMGLQAFYAVHDSLVAAPIYKKALDGTAVTLSYATTTSPYKFGAHYFYPIVQPVADVAYSKVTQSKVLNHLVEYWKPTVVTA